MNSRAVLALVLKDLTLFFRDKRALILSFVAPIAIGAFFGFLFSDRPGAEKARIPILVVDQDRSDLSQKLGARLGKDSQLGCAAATLAEAEKQVRAGKVAAALVLPPGFGTAACRAFFRPETKPELRLLLDPSRAMETGLVKGLLTQAAMEEVSREVFQGPTGRKMVKESLADVRNNLDLGPSRKMALDKLLSGVDELNREPAGAAGEGAGSMPGLGLPYDLKEEVLTRPGVKYNGYAHSFGGMGIQFVLFMGIDAGIGLLLLRRSGLWSRLMASPLTRGQLLLARALSAALLAFIILMGIFLAARLLFAVKIEGSFPGFLAVAAAFSLFTAAFGLLIAALGRTPEAARGLAILATLLLVMLGGGWVPAFVFPAWLQKLTLAIPTRWAMDALDAVTWRGHGFAAAALPCLMLLVFAAVLGVIALWRFNATEG
jgi:ABC-2 type transport system permease protein